MKKAYSLVMIAVIAFSLLTGCQAKQDLADPPDVSVKIGEKDINLGCTVLQWNGKELQTGNPLKDFVVDNIGESDPSFKTGETVDIVFPKTSPEMLYITDALINEKGNLMYSDIKTADIPVEIKDGKYTFDIIKHPESALSSTYDNNRKDIHGIRMTATWGKSVCQYVFYIKTDADQ